MLSYNYISGTDVRVVIDVVSVMGVYFDLLCVCVVHRAEGYCIGIIIEQKPKVLILLLTAASGADDWLREHSCSRCTQ